ncbi:hypothetical protein [Sphingobium sp. EM0848]|uniref:hypothetical protein n=1 Tax=Sphingobium sp. EM0848 TaxID=2743473 RepID=UPI00159C60EA|nr:hypothetical protein [Sphingobium sp. EM0848]
MTDADQPRISQRLADEQGEMKAELLRVHVASDLRVALDLATELRANAPDSRLTGYKNGTPAAEDWMKFDAGIDRSWTEHAHERDHYDAFCALAEEVRAAWFGWSIARTMQAIPAGRTGSRFVAHLGQKLEIDVASWWRPTVTNYFDRMSKASFWSTCERTACTVQMPMSVTAWRRYSASHPQRQTSLRAWFVM